MRARSGALRAALLGLALLGAAACGSDQDPAGFETDPGTGPSVTSRLLEDCPPGGPDATTPAAGCLDEDGKVVH